MKNILIVVDMQKGFQRNEITKKTAQDICKLLELKLFDGVIATRFINSPQSQYFQWLNWKRLLSSPDTDLEEGIANNSDFVVDKYIYNSVNDELLSCLKLLNDGVNPEYVFICGVDTDCCVQITATNLFETGIHPIVLTKYCSSNAGEESHLAGLKVLRRLIGPKHLIEGEISSKEDLKTTLDTVL